MSPWPVSPQRHAAWLRRLSRLGLSLALATTLTFAPNPRPALALPQSYVVDMPGDTPGLSCTGADLDCTLRSAVNLANTDGSDSNITFDADYAITLNSTLMLTATHTTITATPSQVIRINANNTGQVFRISASDTTLDGLRMYGAATDTSIIWISDNAQRVRLANNVIGDDDPGVLGACGNSPNARAGIYISSAANPAGNDALAWIYGNTIKCVAGSPGHGIQIAGSREVVIGENSADQAGNAQLNLIYNNAANGVLLSPGSNFNVLRNTIVQSSGASGVFIHDSDSNQVFGNQLHGNGLFGVHLYDGASSNSIGCLLFAGDPDDPALRNLIYDNALGGVVIEESNTDSNLVLCNWIGLDSSGSAHPNGGHGVQIQDGARSNIIGAGPTTYNVISGNTGSGVLISGDGTSQNLVQGNYIGTSVSGDGVIANGGDEVRLLGGASQNTIGGASALARNVIAGNLYRGVFIGETSTATNTVSYNDIGLNSAAGNLALPNGWDGIALAAGTHGNVIGGPGRGNNIAYNGLAGVNLKSGAHDNSLEANAIFSNVGPGVLLEGVGTEDNTLSEVALFFNGEDGVAERDNATGNTWSQLSTYGNGGLGIDRSATDPAANAPTAPYPVILLVDPATGLISGVSAPSAIVELYRAAPDALGFGEGLVFIASTTANLAGSWHLDVAPGLPNCYTAFQTLGGSSEFSRHTCPTLFLPQIIR